MRFGRAEQMLEAGGRRVPSRRAIRSLVVADEAGVAEQQRPDRSPERRAPETAWRRPEPKQLDVDWRNFLSPLQSDSLSPRAGNASDRYRAAA